ncbi:MAG: hypothetical protein NTV03_03305 [Candidatus Nomurabacteria bacterium]|nr:hypothetical protein [Candidatus Nomurabacteria bacterium]
MEEINKNYVDNLNESGNKILSVFCFDSVGVKDRTTFDSCVIDGIQFTFWMDDDEDVVERVNRMFDTLFEEMVKDMEKSEVKVVDY